MNLQRRLTDLREAKNMSKKELAAAINIKPNNLSKYEKGLSKPTIPTLIKMAEYFEVSVDYLLGLSSIKNPYSSDRFTPKETEIITKYRKLAPENKIRIDERLSAMIDGQGPKWQRALPPLLEPLNKFNAEYTNDISNY